jgi:hypothetical protein
MNRPSRSGSTPSACSVFSARSIRTASPVEARHQVFGLIAGSDIEIPFGRDASVSPMFGLGPAMFAKSTDRPAASGTLWMLGVQLRLGRLLIRQQFIGLTRAQEAIPEFREYYPLTVGWRF